jgi:hypothetical protein
MPPFFVFSVETRWAPGDLMLLEATRQSREVTSRVQAINVGFAPGITLNGSMLAISSHQQCVV